MEAQHLLPKTNDRPGILDGEEQWHHLLLGIEAPGDHFDHNQETLMRSHRVDGGRCADGPLPHTAGVERNQRVAPVPAEIPPVEINNAGAQTPSKREMETAQDHGGGEPERRRAQNEPQSLQNEEYIPVRTPEAGIA
jgi:hypothetical protein